MVDVFERLVDWSYCRGREDRSGGRRHEHQPELDPPLPHPFSHTICQTQSSQRLKNPIFSLFPLLPLLSPALFPPSITGLLSNLAEAAFFSAFSATLMAQKSLLSSLWVHRGTLPCQPTGLEGSLKNRAHGSVYIVQEETGGIETACTSRSTLVHLYSLRTRVRLGH